MCVCACVRVCMRAFCVVCVSMCTCPRLLHVLTPPANLSFPPYCSDALTMNNHVSGITPTTFATNSKLSSFFNVISTNVDRKGRAFVSTIEGVLCCVVLCCVVNFLGSCFDCDCSSHFHRQKHAVLCHSVASREELF